jgi:hypothetical protein
MQNHTLAFRIISGEDLIQSAKEGNFFSCQYLLLHISDQGHQMHFFVQNTTKFSEHSLLLI